jgi:hypothetical protein
MTDILDDETLNPPESNDFRRIGQHKIPQVRDPNDPTKWVRYRRASKAGEILDDEFNLWDWKRRTEIVGAAQRPELMALVSTLNPDTDKKQLRDICEQCLDAGRGNQRSTQGTAVHSMFDLVDRNESWAPAPQFQPVVDAYLNALNLYGLIPEDIEVRCVNDKFRLAGTLDRRYRTTRALVAPDGSVIPIGSYLVGDTKTGKTLEYTAGTYSTQLAGYVDSVRYDTKTDDRIPFDPPNHPDWALIVHAIPEAGTCELHWVDINAGREGLKLADQVRQWRKRTDLLSLAEPPVRVGSQRPASVPVASDQPSEAPTEPEPQSEPTEAVRAWLIGRVGAIRSHSEIATQRLLRLWPAGVPGLKREGHSMSELDAIALVLDQVEADYSIPFGESDPRMAGSKLRHPSYLPSKVDMAITGFRNMAGFTMDENSELLHGTLRAIGYPKGIDTPQSEMSEADAALILSAAVAITGGTALLLFEEDGQPIVRFDVRQTNNVPAHGPAQ